MSVIHPPGVIVIQQNLGEGRHENPLSLRYWDQNEAERYSPAWQYNQWIQTAKHEFVRQGTLISP